MRSWIFYFFQNFSLLLLFGAKRLSTSSLVSFAVCRINSWLICVQSFWCLNAVLFPFLVFSVSWLNSSLFFFQDIFCYSYKYGSIICSCSIITLIFDFISVLQVKQTMSSNPFRYSCPCGILLLVTMVTVFACFVESRPENEKKRSNPVVSFLRSQRLKSKALLEVSHCSISLQYVKPLLFLPINNGDDFQQTCFIFGKKCVGDIIETVFCISGFLDFCQPEAN